MNFLKRSLYSKIVGAGSNIGITGLGVDSGVRGLEVIELEVFKTESWIGLCQYEVMAFSKTESKNKNEIERTIRQSEAKFPCLPNGLAKLLGEFLEL